MSHDQWVTRLAGVLGDILLLPDTLALYRRHEAAATRYLVGGNRRVQRSNRALKRLRRSFKHTTAATYRNQARAAASQARVLGHLGRTTAPTDWRPKLLQAQAHFEALAAWCDNRAALYPGARPRQRLRRLPQLADNRGYARFCGGAALGLAGLGRDLVVAAVGAPVGARPKRTGRRS